MKTIGSWKSNLCPCCIEEVETILHVLRRNHPDMTEIFIDKTKETRGSLEDIYTDLTLQEIIANYIKIRATVRYTAAHSKHHHPIIYLPNFFNKIISDGYNSWKFKWMCPWCSSRYNNIGSSTLFLPSYMDRHPSKKVTILYKTFGEKISDSFTRFPPTN